MERLITSFLNSIFFWVTVFAEKDPFLAVTIAHFSVHDVGIIDLETDVPRNLSLKNLVEPVGIDYDPVDDKIYFSDRNTQIIGRVNLNGTDQETVFAFGDDARLEDIALNPWSRLLFWVDSYQGAIFVTNLEFAVWKKLIEGNLIKPRGLVAHLETSFIYWSEWFDEDVMNTAKIERAAMSGEAREVIVDSEIYWPNGITIDVSEGRLYWCDAYLDRIESVDLDGSNRILVLGNSTYLKHPFSLSLYGDYFYWTEARQNAVVKASRDGLNRTYSLLRFGGNFGVNGLAVSSFASGTNACSRSNGGCFTSQLCLPEPSGRICTCLESRDQDESCFYRSSEEPILNPGDTDTTGTQSDITIEGCPGDTTITVETDKDSITVTWVEPVATDPDGLELDAYQSYTPGDLFRIGTTTVIYAYTYQGQTKVCTFNVKVVTKAGGNQMSSDGASIPGSLLTWAAIGAIILLFAILLVCVGICCFCCPREKPSRRDGSLVAMETTDDDLRRGSMNTLTSNTSLTVNGSFRKQDKKKNKKWYQKNMNNSSEFIVQIPGYQMYEETNGNRFMDGTINYENSGRFNTLR